MGSNVGFFQHVLHDSAIPYVHLLNWFLNDALIGDNLAVAVCSDAG